MSKGYMYILECADGSYYTGSTKNLERRFAQHQSGEGANHTEKRLPVKLVYYEEYQRIDEAFYREKQVQGWSRKKKEALMNGATDELKNLAECMNKSHYNNGTSASLSRLNSDVNNGTSASLSRLNSDVNNGTSASLSRLNSDVNNKVVDNNKVVERSRNHSNNNLKRIGYE